MQWVAPAVVLDPRLKREEHPRIIVPVRKYIDAKLLQAVIRYHNIMLQSKETSLLSTVRRRQTCNERMVQWVRDMIRDAADKELTPQYDFGCVFASALADPAKVL